MASITPVGVAQKKVLDALNMTATDWTAAQRIFEDLGIEVTSRRVGRSSEPVVRRKQTVFGAFNAEGEGEAWSRSYRRVDLTPIAQWIVK